LVKIQIVRRWAVVAAGVALLCGLPVIASAPPVSTQLLKQAATELTELVTLS